MLNRVLVVEDDPLTCELIQEVLSSAEIDAHAVTNSSHAALRLRERKFDAAFLDAHMPSPDGIELARQIRASGLNKKTVIVMITGEQDPRFVTRAFQVGVNFVLFKPVDRQVLLRLIRVTQGPIERERQRFTRVNIRCKVSMEFGQDRIEGTTLDLSVNGMQVQASRLFPVGSLVRLDLELSPKEPALRETARVVRLVGENCMGLELEKLGLAESERLEEFLLPLVLAQTDKAPQNTATT